MHKLIAAVVLASTTPAAVMMGLTRLGPPTADAQAAVTAVGFIHVDGTASLSVVPDVATMTFEVTHTATTREEADAALDATVADVLAALGKAGARPHELKTLERTAAPLYARNRDGSPRYLEVLRWTVTRRVQACAHDAALVANWQKAARGAGALEVGGVAWETSRLVELKREARLKAAAEARLKAAALVDELGGRLGAPTTISESAGSTTDPTAYKRANVSESDTEGAVVVADLAGGTIAVVASVQVAFEILRR
jgi:uncharacterized protein YggE